MTGGMLMRAVKRAFRSAGLEISRYGFSAAGRLERMLALYGVDAIFDIGANQGQSGDYFRSLGFRQKIVSFEPVSRCFARLKARAAGDSLWHVENVALGRTEGRAMINVSGGHGGASSIMEATEIVGAHATDQRIVGGESVLVTTLDSMVKKHYPQGDRCFLKLDVQGYEKAVLDGGSGSLHRIVGMKIETSLVEIYRGETLLWDMLPYLYGLGFRLVAIENGWSNPGTGEMYQVDCTLFKTERVDRPWH